MRFGEVMAFPQDQALESSINSYLAARVAISSFAVLVQQQFHDAE
jgi:hypothetical protein